MEGKSSGDELVLKVRKPYTITKLRERWTEEEHARFIEAIKLYGRAWQRIEEHVGTKTAVQIRSHAQKFFTKLEKEAVTKGVPLGQTHGIDIPPPRPKRKTCSPYPRNGKVHTDALGKESLTTKSEELQPIQHIKMGMSSPNRDYPSEKNACSEILRTEVEPENGNSSEVLDVGREAICTSFFTEDKNFQTYSPAMTDKAVVECEEQILNQADNTDAEVTDMDFRSPKKGDQTVNLSAATTVHSDDTLRRPDSAKDQLSGTTLNDYSFVGMTLPPAPLPNSSTVPSEPNVCQANAPFVPFYCDHDTRKPFFDPSAFSAILLSTIMQNPAVYAAARIAATFWQATQVTGPNPASQEEIADAVPTSQTNAYQCMHALVAATVAAASAWWTAQGVLPLFPPMMSCSFASMPTSVVTTAEAMQPQEVNRNALQDLSNQQMESDAADKPEACKTPSSDSDATERVNELQFLEFKIGDVGKSVPPSVDGLCSANSSRKKNMPGRSSCGSNTPSSSDVELDSTLQKHEKGNDDAGAKIYFGYTMDVESNHRRSRGTGATNESWKSVSQEGRLAFQALFNREVLPQSFSPPHAGEEPAAVVRCKAKASEGVELDINAVASGEHNCKFIPDVKQGNSFHQLAQHKLKSRFKPYKRCSGEAKEKSATPSAEQACNKRLRVDGDAAA